VRLWPRTPSGPAGDVRGQVLHVQTGQLTGFRDLDGLIDFFERRSTRSQS